MVAKSERARARSIFDAMVSAAGLLLLSPLLLIAALAVVLEDGLPVFFWQSRVGRNGVFFQLVKLRSMSARARGRKITASGDPRLTRVGRVLRKYKVDELPQLWNVVRGEMSLVGPRPEVPAFVSVNDPIWRAVLQVRPGITDLASLVYRNEEEILGTRSNPEPYYRDVILPAKLALNLRYMQTRTFWRDIKLILLTVRYSFFPARFDSSAILQAFPAKATDVFQPQNVKLGPCRDDTSSQTR